MASSTVHRRVRAAAVAAVQALAITDWDNNALPVLARKLPAVDEELDALPCLVVALGNEPVGAEPASTEGHWYFTYPLEFVFVAAGKGDWFSHMDDYLVWHARLINLFRPPTLSGVAEVWDTEVSPQVVIRRDLVNQQYDYGGILVRFRTCEEA